MSKEKPERERPGAPPPQEGVKRAKDGRFQKGTKAGPGRQKGPRRRSFMQTLRDVEKKFPDKTTSEIFPGAKPMEVAVLLTIEAANEREPWAIRELLDRGFGKPTQPIEVSDPVELPLSELSDDQLEELATSPTHDDEDGSQTEEAEADLES